MNQPIEVRVDLEAKAGYVQYRSDVAIAGTVDVWHDGQVAADLDDQERIIGIEVLGFDDATLDRARSYAHEHDLAFPENLAGVLVSA